MVEDPSRLAEICSLYFVKRCATAKSLSASKTPKKKRFLSFIGLLGLSAIQEVGNFIGAQIGLYGSSAFTANTAIKSAAALAGDYTGGSATFFSSYFYSFREEFRYSSRDFLAGEHQTMPIGLSHIIDAAVETKEMFALDDLVKKINAKHPNQPYTEELEQGLDDFIATAQSYVNSDKAEEDAKRFGKANYRRGVFDVVSQLGAGMLPTAVVYGYAGPLAKHLLDKGVSNFATGCWITVTTFVGFNLLYFPAYEYIKSGKLIEHIATIKGKLSASF